MKLGEKHVMDIWLEAIFRRPHARCVERRRQLWMVFGVCIECYRAFAHRFKIDTLDEIH